MRTTTFRYVTVVAAGLLLVACGATTPSVTPLPSPASMLPAPTGDRAVGVRDLAPVADGFTLRAWYPAALGTGEPGAPYLTAAAWDGLLREVRPWVPTTATAGSVLPRLRTTAAKDAEPTSGGPRPVVLLMPGWWQPAASMTILAADLASHGYIVITIDPPRGSEPAGSDDGVLAARQPIRLAAVDAALDVVGDPAVARQIGSMDMDRIAVGGHSFGGTVRLRLQPRRTACEGGLRPRWRAWLHPGRGAGARPCAAGQQRTRLPECDPPGSCRGVPTPGLDGDDDGRDPRLGSLRPRPTCPSSTVPPVHSPRRMKPGVSARSGRMARRRSPSSSAASSMRRSVPRRRCPDAADLIKDVPGGYIDPLGVGH